jgi:hypothetical protein
MLALSKTNLLADGSESAVFKNPDDPSTVIAISSGAWYEMRHSEYDSDNYEPITDECPKYQIFQKYPDLFPKVFEVTKEWVTLERLDSERARVELEDIGTILDLSIPYTINNYKLIKAPSRWNNTQKIALEALKPYADIVDQLRKRLTRSDLKKLVRMDKMFDIHEENWGYDCNGTLKLLDL